MRGRGGARELLYRRGQEGNGGAEGPGGRGRLHPGIGMDAEASAEDTTI